MTILDYVTSLNPMYSGPIHKIAYDLSYYYLKFILGSIYDSDLQKQLTVFVWLLILIHDLLFLPISTIESGAS